MNSHIVLETPLVMLRPVNMADLDAFIVLADEPEMWEFYSVNMSDPQTMKKWLTTTLDEKAAGQKIPFTIIEKNTGRIAGSMSIGNISEFDMRAEIGWSWLGKDFRKTGVNFHAKYAMLHYLFDDLQFERVEFKTDVLNERAKNGLRKIGGTEEGVLRSHMKMWNNRRRDSIYFSILKKEWPQIKTTIFKDLAS